MDQRTTPAKDGFFKAIPAELVIIILSLLDVRSILRCRLLSHLFNDLYERSASLQYKVELAVSGMQDGPPSTVSPASRLQMLRDHQQSWNMLDWKRDENITTTDECSMWEVSGGVFAQHRKTDNIVVFWTLPSVNRGIDGRSWTVPLHGVNLQDFVLDPAQDLLVLIEDRPVLHKVNGNKIHLRTLFTGAAHPLASNPLITHIHDTLESSCHYCLRIFADYIGILFSPGLHSELVIWNWKTGYIELRLLGVDSFSFAFLTERHILLAVPSDGSCLRVVDFKKSSPTPQGVWPAVFLCSFGYPFYVESFDIMDMTIRSDPAPSWKPNNHSKVPFSVASDNRLFVISITWRGASGLIPNENYLLVPSSTFVAHMNTIDEGQEGHFFEWRDWGPSGSRLWNLDPSREDWVCYVFGTKFVIIREEPGLGAVVSICDFNQLAYRRDHNRTRGQTTAMRFVSADDPSPYQSSSPISEVIAPTRIRTSLPYRTWTRRIPVSTASTDDVMCSEDNVVIVGVCTLSKASYSTDLDPFIHS